MESFRKHAASFLVTVLVSAMAVPTVPVMAQESSSIQETSTRTASDEKYFGTKLPRYEQPAADNPYYFSNRNIFYASNYGMPNCTAYAWGRAYEYYGTRPSLSYYNAGQWWYDNIEWGAYEYGSEPRVGAIAVWDRWDQNQGHVAFVEAVNGNQVTLSESAWQGDMFRVRTMKADGSNYLSGGVYRFLGYIYVDEPYHGASSVAGEQWRMFDSVVARYGPGTSYGSWVTVPAGAEVNVLETTESEGYLWGKIYYAGVEAWCVLNYATCISNPSLTPDPPEESLPTQELRRIDSSNGVNLRSGPGTKYEIVVWLPHETVMTVTAIAEGSEYTWAKASYNGVEGWFVYDYTIPYIESNEPENPSNGETPSDEPADDVVAPEDRPILKMSSRGQDVRELQEMLNSLGFDAGEADGIFGADTDRAVKAFQQSVSIDVDGVVGIATWKALYAAQNSGSNGMTPEEPNEPEVPEEPETPAEDYTTFPEIYMYKSGVSEYVTKLQERLNALGYDCGEVDGIFGRGTRVQVVAFQEDQGLVADGIVGTATWAVLYANQAETPEEPETPTEPEAPTEPETPTEPGAPSEDYTSFPEIYMYKRGVTEYVKKLQERLNILGYDCGTVDGIFGAGTRTQVMAFQNDQGLTADGIVGTATWKALYSTGVGGGDAQKPEEPAEPETPAEPEAPAEPETPTEDYTSFPEIYQYQSNQYVTKLQERLNALGYDIGCAPTGYFGSATYQQVVAFQQANGLVADGIVGVATWRALYQA